MKRLLLFLLTIMTLPMHATEITLDKYDIKELSSIELKLESIYAAAFGQVYKDYWTDEFAQKCMSSFYRYIEQFKQSNDMLLVVAKKDDCIAGWILFLCHGQQAVIDIICIDPTFQKQGIGKALVFSIKNYAAEIKSLAVVTRKVNIDSPLFYEGLGFVKTNFIHGDYKPDEMQGYECLMGEGINAKL